MMNIILASKSPRRRAMLTLIGLAHTAVDSGVKENAPEGLGPAELVMYLAQEKARAVCKRNPGALVIGADTVVYIGGEILGKPRDEEDAAAILHKLSNRTHTVYTGVAVMGNGREDVRFDAAKVTFAKLTDEEIRWYIDTREPFDKAGAYGIQGPGGIFVDRVEGNYFTVIGLPLPLLYRMLCEAGVPLGAFKPEDGPLF